MMNVSFRKGKLKEIYNNKHKCPDGSFIYAEDAKRLYLKMDGELIGITHKIKIVTNCCNCGAPLPLATSSVVQCPYCSTVQDVEEDFKGIDNSTEELEPINIPSGIPLNTNLSDEEVKNLKALADDDGYIRIGG